MAVTPRRRVAASVALGAGVAAPVVAAWASGSIGRLVVIVAAVVVAELAGYVAVTSEGPRRWVFSALTAATLVVVVILVGADWAALALVAGLVATSAVAARLALARDVRALIAAPTPGRAVAPAHHGVLLMNPRSGGGVVEGAGLVDEARRRGIEGVVLEEGDDLAALAGAAVDRGADVIGMAGGDGSQAVVAAVARDRDVAFVCVPAGTRNHFAIDLGLDPADVVTALDGFTAAVERTVDLAELNGRVFVNNASLGFYARIVQSEEYREHKLGTALAALPEVLGPDAEPFDLRFTGPDGEAHPGAHVILVSNNPYELFGSAAFGSRQRLDDHVLGIVTLELSSPADVAKLVALEAARQAARHPGLLEWSAPTFTVDSDAPVEVGLDGEATVLDAPLEFRTLPDALRVRIPRKSPGLSPAATAPRLGRATVVELVRTTLGTSRAQRR